MAQPDTWEAIVSVHWPKDYLSEKVLSLEQKAFYECVESHKVTLPIHLDSSKATITGNKTSTVQYPSLWQTYYSNNIGEYCFQFDCRVPQATVTDYGASNAGLLEHVGSALTLVTIVMNRTIVFQCST